MGRIKLTDEQKRIADSIRDGQGTAEQEAPAAYRGGRVTLNQKQIQTATKYGLPNPDYGKNTQSGQTSVDDPLHRQYAAFMAYQNAVREAQLAQIRFGEKRTRNNTDFPDVLSEQEFSRSPAMQQTHGTYQDYLRGMVGQYQAAYRAHAADATAKRAEENLAAGKVSEAEFGRSSAMVQRYGTYQNYLDGKARPEAEANKAASKVTEQEFGRSPAMQQTYGTYQNYLRGKTAGYDAAMADVTAKRAEANLAAGKVSEAEFNRSSAMVERYGTYRNYLNGETRSAEEVIDSRGLADLLERYYNAEGEEQQQLRQELAARGVSGEELSEWRRTVYNRPGNFVADAAEGFFHGGLLQNMTGIEGAMASLENKTNKTIAGTLRDVSGVLPDGTVRRGALRLADEFGSAQSTHEENARILQDQHAQLMQELAQGHTPVGSWIIEQMPSAGNMVLNAASAGMIGVPSLATLGTTAGGSAYIDARNDGASHEQALAYGLVNGALEVFSEKLFGGNPLYDTDAGLMNRLVAKLTDNKTVMRILNSKGFDLLSEGLEEVFTEITEPWAQALIYAGKDADFVTWESAANAFAGGVFLSVAGNLVDLPNSIRSREAQRTINAVAEQVLMQAEMVDNEAVQQAAADVREKMDYGEDATIEDIGSILNAMSEAGAEVDTAAVAEETAQNAQEAAQGAQEAAQRPAYDIYKDAVQTAQENTRAAQQYAEAERRAAQNANIDENAPSELARQTQQAQRAAQQQYDQNSLFAPIDGTEGMGELDVEQYARQQTADAEQALDEAAVQQEEQYLQAKASEAGYDDETAAHFLNGNTTGIPVEQYVQSFQRVYEQGEIGVSEQRAMRYAEGMNQDVAAAAYRAGLAAGQKGVNNGSIAVTGEGPVGQAGQRAEGTAGGVRQSTAQRQRADAGRKRAESARNLAKTWDEVSGAALGLGEGSTQTVRVMPKGGEAQNEDIKAAVKFLRTAGVENARFFTGQLAQTINGETFYADGAVLEDGTVLIRADSEEYSAFELAKHEGYHILAERYPEMAAKIRQRLLAEGKITREMIESYVDAYARAYGDDMDAYVEEIIADAYAGMNRTDYGTNQLHADVKMEAGQWQKKTGSARAPPAKTQYSIKKDNKGKNYVDVPIWAMQIKSASEVGKALSDIVRKQFRSWVDVAGQKIGINQRTAGEWTFSKDAQRLYSKNKTAYADKVNAFGVAGELLQASRDYIGEQAKHFRKDNFREFARGKVSFKVGANGYEADIIVGTTTKGAAILYDMVNITPKKIAEAPNTTLSAQNAEDRRQGTSARESISKTGETVKKKFSMSSPAERTKDFVALHNKDWNVIRDAALNWGGIPSPSIAIVDAQEGHSEYGDTSVVYSRKTIAPETDSRNKVYGGDAWTPTAANAIVEREVNYAARRAVEQKIEQLANQVAGGIFSRDSVIGSRVDEVSAMDEAELAKELARDDTVRAAYLAEQGQDVEPVLKEKVWDSFGNQTLQDYTEKIGAQELAQLYVKLATGDRLTDAELETARESIMDAWIADHEYALNRRPELREARIARQRDKISDARVEDFIRNAEALYEDGGQTRDGVDRYATQDKLRAAVDDAEVEAWVSGQLRGVLGEPGIYNGKERFTASGRRKSFRETHGAYTAENIVEAMNRASARGESYWGVGAKGILSVATPRYGSVDAIHADEARLQKMPEDEYNRLLRELDERIEEIVTDVQKASGNYDMDEIAGLLMENAGKNAANIRRKFRDQGYNIGSSLAEEIEGMYRQAAKMPTGYFEAKPQRVVPFGEAVAIIAPDSTPKQEVEAVERATGTSVILYKEGDNKQRIKILNGLNGVRFSAQGGSYRDLMGEKPAQYVRGLERRLVNELAENLSVPGQAKRDVLRPMAEDALRTFFADGQLDRAKLNDLFETAYKAGMEEDRQYIEQYGDLKKFIRDQKISISEKDRQDIADYDLFRKAAMGTMTISKDGLPVDVAYQQLQEMAPELFPADITAPSDQLMQIYDVARGIQKVQKTLDEYYGPRAASFKAWQQANFSESIDRMTSGLRIAQRYLDAQNRAKEKLAIPQTQEETKQMWAQLKDARRTVEKAQGKTLLTEADQKIVNRLLRGETDPAYVAGLENGQQILKVYEAKAEYDMLALKLKAWNVQRRQGLKDFAEQALTEAEAVKWVDKSMGIQYQRETMERNIRDIARKGKVSDEKANAFINKYFWPVHENESKRKTYIVEKQDQIRALKLDRHVQKGNLVSESYAVQWLGEAEFNRDYLKEHPRVEKRGGMDFSEWNAAIQEFEKQNPNLDLGKVRGAVKVFHEVYDKLFEDMNRVRIENGYEPVNYLQGYFPHFQESEAGGSLLQKFARAAGIEGDVSPLPATINGLTASFKPGIRYMANIQNRLGYATAYDALQGFDRYIEVASDVIYHTADIQRLRALATQIRWRASDEALQKRIDAIRMDPFLNPDEANDQIANLTKEGRYALSNLVDELDEYTNLLAGKKSRLDRGMEKMLGRRAYNVMKKFESRVGANMVAANVGSALTNFIPITQAWSQVSTADVLRGMWQTLRNYKTADGLDAASTFINNRSGYGRLAETTMDKISAGAGWLMESVDTFTTGSVVRARYYQNLRRGMSEANAMQEADQFASGVMADRSKGSTPTLYSARNPLVKLFTQFQLEVNNELSWIFKDMAQEERKKGVAALAKALFKFLIGSWIYNEFYEAVVGRRAALDPLDIINDTVGDFTGYQLPNTVQAAVSGKWDFTKEKPGTYQAIKNFEGNIISEFPGTQALTILGIDEALGLDIDSGRIAVASAIPNLGKIEKALLAKGEDMAPAKKAKTITDELLKPALYVATPFGGGQLRKLYQGWTAASKGGSYSVDNDGHDILQYPVYNDNTKDAVKSWTQAILFGKTATEEAQSWVESGFKSLSAKETAAYQIMTTGGTDQRESYAFVNAMKKVDDKTAKLATLYAYDIPQTAKTAYYYSVLASDEERAKMDALDADGVSYDDYMQYKQYYFKAYGTQTVSQERMQTILDGLNLTKKQKAAIWAALGKDWKEENNPYK